MEAPKTPFTITGGTWPAEIWARFAAGALSGTPYGSLPEADTSGMVTVEVDLSTGFSAGPYCPRESVQRIQVPAALAVDGFEQEFPSVEIATLPHRPAT